MLIDNRASQSVQLVGVFSDEGPLVPIPNTVVKLISADNTWLEAAREDKAMPTQYHLSSSKVVNCFKKCLNSSVGRARGC